MNGRQVQIHADPGERQHETPRFRNFRFTGWDRGMMLPWSALRQRFDATIRAASTPRLFQRLRVDLPALACFQTAEDLIGYLGEDLKADLDAKDVLYSQLVMTARAGEPESALAQSLLWIGLWPGLSAAFFRRLFFWQDDPGELVSVMTSAFTRLVARLDFARVRRVVGTLVRSTERDVIQADLARARHREQLVNFEWGVEQIGDDTSTPDAGESEVALLIGLRRLVHRKMADPVLRALILGGGSLYVAAALGVKPAAARQRLCRARRQLRAALAEAGGETRFG
jgi:hypothetical protein